MYQVGPVRGRAGPDLDRFRVEDGGFEEGKQLVVVVGENVDGDGVYCLLYSGWCHGE